ncbi:MAG: NAD(P)-dependent oxidoreductase, partial [Pseudomonadota bacterium]
MQSLKGERRADADQNERQGGVSQGIKRAEQELRTGGKKDFFKNHVGLELYQAQLGLVGLGRIGSHVAKVALALGMTVRAYDPYISLDQANKLG